MGERPGAIFKTYSMKAASALKSNVRPIALESVTQVRHINKDRVKKIVHAGTLTISVSRFLRLLEMRV